MEESEHVTHDSQLVAVSADPCFTSSLQINQASTNAIASADDQSLLAETLKAIDYEPPVSLVADATVCTLRRLHTYTRPQLVDCESIFWGFQNICRTPWLWLQHQQLIMLLTSSSCTTWEKTQPTN